METLIQDHLDAALAQIMEDMFFAEVEPAPPTEEPCEGPAMVAVVEFTGPGSAGRLSVTAPCGGLQNLAAAFLGLDFDETPTEDNAREVMGETANMICGSLLSKLDPEAQFDLQTPQVQLGAAEPVVAEHHRSYQIEGERFQVHFTWAHRA